MCLFFILIGQNFVIAHSHLKLIYMVNMFQFDYIGDWAELPPFLFALWCRQRGGPHLLFYNYIQVSVFYVPTLIKKVTVLLDVHLKHWSQCSNVYEHNTYKHAHIFKSKVFSCYVRIPPVLEWWESLKGRESDPNKRIHVGKDKNKEHHRNWAPTSLWASLPCEWFSRQWKSAAKRHAACLRTVQVQKLAVDTNSKVWGCPAQKVTVHTHQTKCEGLA